MRSLIILVALLCGLPAFAAQPCSVQVPTLTAEVGDVRLAYQSIGRDADPALLMVMGLGGQLIHWPDEVVERLRMYGLELTPKPLTHTAWEYYNMNYDRHADRRERDARRAAETAVEEEVVEEAQDEDKPRGLFGFRKKPVAAPEQSYEVEGVAEEVVVPEPVAEPAPAPAPAPVYAAPEPEPVAADPVPETSGTEPKPNY